MKPRWPPIRASVRRLPSSHAPRTAIHASQPVLSLPHTSPPPIPRTYPSRNTVRRFTEAAHPVEQHVPSDPDHNPVPIHRTEIGPPPSADPSGWRPLLADRPLPAHGTWALALQDRQHTHGDAGVVDFWRALRRHRVHLPERGEDAAFLWPTLLAVPELVDEVVDYAAARRARGHRVYGKVYSRVVTHAMRDRGRFGDPVHWHHRLVGSGLVTEQDFRMMARYAAGRAESVGSLQRIFLRESDERYREMILEVLKGEGKLTLASEWRALVKQQTPSPETGGGKQKSKISVEEADPGKSVEHRDGGSRFMHSKFPKLTIRSKAETGETTTDDLLSRILATRAFSIHAIIKGLSMFSSPLIGTSALRTIALRSGDSKTFLENLRGLSEANVAIEASRYTHMLLKLAAAGRDEELQVVVSSDQHPSNFDDSALQERLLQECLSRGDLESARPILTFLTLSSSHPTLDAWNMILQHYAIARDVVRIHQTIDRMEADEIYIQADTLTMLYQYCLRWRRGRRRPPTLPGVRPPAGRDKEDVESLASGSRPFTRDDEVFALLGIWKKIITSGYNISPLRWREPIRRLAQLAHFEELRKLCGWLADWYAPRNSSQSFGKGWGHSRMQWAKGSQREKVRARTILPPSDPRHPLQRLFNEGFQEAVIASGLRHGIRKAFDWDSRVRAYKNGKWKARAGPGTAKDPALSGGTLPYSDWAVISEMEAQRRKYEEQDTIAEFIKRPDPSVFTGGLQILTELQRQHGVRVSVHDTRRVVDALLWRIYGVGTNTKRIYERFQRINPYKLEEMVLAMEQSWGVRGEGLWPALMTMPEAHDRTVSGQSRRLSLIEQLSGDATKPRAMSRAATEVLQPEEAHRRRMRMAFVVFGPSPAIIGEDLRRGMTDAKRIPPAAWNKMVRRWAVNGEGNFGAYREFALASSQRHEESEEVPVGWSPT